MSESEDKLIGSDSLSQESASPVEEGSQEQEPSQLPAEQPGESKPASLEGPRVAKAPETGPDTPNDLLLGRLESLIFVSPEPITARRLARILSIDGKLVADLLERLKEHYQERGIVLENVAGGYQFRSNPENANVLRHVFKMKPIRLSRPSLETLAIIAYRQPITRVEVEEIRGVDCGGVLKLLFEKELVRVLGRREGPGRPILYGTSRSFLELFGLKSLSDLPALHEFSELWSEHQEILDEEHPQDEKSDKPLEETLREYALEDATTKSEENVNAKNSNQPAVDEETEAETTEESLDTEQGP